jgi:hypothetical protein
MYKLPSLKVANIVNLSTPMLSEKGAYFPMIEPNCKLRRILELWIIKVIIEQSRDFG